MVEEKKEEKTQNKELKEGKLYAILGYLSILCLVPLLLKKDNKFATHHAKQGLILFIWLVAASIIAPIPFLGLLIWMISAILIVVLSAVGIIQVLMGKLWKMPYISNIASKISV